jgi:hypothetical protein
MTPIVMNNADFLWIIRVYHNHQRHPRSIYCELPKIAIIYPSAKKRCEFFFRARNSPSLL